MTPRADAVKDGRCCAAASHSAVARPRLDGGEHDVMLGWSGPSQKNPEHRVFNGCYELCIDGDRSAQVLKMAHHEI
jgi:hypothetical protein